MTSYQDLQQQAAELLRQAEELRAGERNAVIQQVREDVAEWNLTAAELGFKPAKADKRMKVVPKYRDPASGATWSGRGVMPQWMAAQVNAGASKDQFLIAA
jgi:DNA-binding protein H-NS